MEWLALMRHYGAPVRLIDWTFSFFVAVYFALEKDKEESAVWAIDSGWLGKKTKEVLYEKGAKKEWKLFKSDRNIRRLDTFNGLFQNPKPVPLVYLVNPYRLNQRLVLQQGIFLCPSDVTIPFEENLAGLWTCKQNKPDGNLVKYTIKGTEEQRHLILRNLHRMNISRASLFPGLGGFSKSLENLLVLPHMLQPHEDFKYQKRRWHFW